MGHVKKMDFSVRKPHQIFSDIHVNFQKVDGGVESPVSCKIYSEDFLQYSRLDEPAFEATKILETFHRYWTIQGDNAHLCSPPKLHNEGPKMTLSRSAS